MARIPYIKEHEHPELAEAISAIRARRSGNLSPVARCSTTGRWSN